MIELHSKEEVENLKAELTGNNLEIKALRKALNASIAMIDGIGRNVAPLEEVELEREVNDALRELSSLKYQ